MRGMQTIDITAFIKGVKRQITSREVNGKPAGVLLATWAARRAFGSPLPDRTTWRHLHGVAWLAGIGFTMSLFIAGQAFAGTAFAGPRSRCSSLRCWLPLPALSSCGGQVRPAGNTRDPRQARWRRPSGAPDGNAVVAPGWGHDSVCLGSAFVLRVGVCY